jgi:hypothetical protein
VVIVLPGPLHGRRMMSLSGPEDFEKTDVGEPPANQVNDQGQISCMVHTAPRRGYLYWSGREVGMQNPVRS